MAAAVKTGRLVLALVALAIVLASCGDDSASDSSSSTLTPTTVAEAAPAPAPEDTTATTASSSSETCLSLASRAISLVDSFRMTMRGVAGPSPEAEEALRAEGQAILDEARRLECPIPASVEQFLSTG